MVIMGVPGNAVFAIAVAKGYCRGSDGGDGGDGGVGVHDVKKYASTAIDNIFFIIII
jgi:hypothetical protein